MTNELLFFITSLANLSFVLFAFRLGRPWLFGIVVTNLILVSVFGSKLVSLFGFVTNAGNIFYAAVFLATHMLLEHYGKKEGYKTIWVGLLSIGLFIAMARLTLLFAGQSESASINEALRVFEQSPRIAIASMAAFIIAQLININLYSRLYVVTNKQLLWFRDNVSNISGQFVDSVIFFTIAFFGVLPNELLLQSIFTGFLIKVVVGLMGTPFLYASYRIQPKYNTDDSTS